MRKNITRTLATSQISGYRVVIVDGKPAVEELPVLTVAGKATETSAQKELEKAYGKGVTVGKIDISEDMYEISVEKFLEVATKVGSDSSEEVSEGSETEEPEVEEFSEGSETVNN